VPPAGVRAEGGPSRGQPTVHPGAQEVTGPRSHKQRNTVERLINKLKDWRGIATRYDKTPDSYLAGLHLRASMIWIKDLTRTTN